MHGRRRQMLLVVGLCAGGCGDPVASNSYQGEVLATLHGLVKGNGGTVSIPMEVALVWGRPDGNGIKFIAEKVPITGSFPAEFTLSLHHPPPARAGWQFPGGRINLGFIAALRKDDWSQGTQLEKGRNVLAYGLTDEVLVHLERDLPAGQGLLGLGGVHTAGFHLVGTVALTADEARREAEACRKQFPAAPAEACEPELAPGGGFQAMREVKDGLAHRMELELMFPDFVVLSGGEEQDPPPCPDCGDLVGPGNGGAVSPGAGADGGATDGPDAGGAFSS
jgi:hypothetical protein